jgi:biotin operon repressor
MLDRKEKARPAGGTAEQAKRESHWASGNPYGNYTTTQSGGQGTISRLLMEGAGNGLHLQDLVRLTGEDQRTVRKMIHEERRRGVPILSDNASGYFLPGSQQEREACVQSLRHRAKEILAAAEAIENAAEV